MAAHSHDLTVDPASPILTTETAEPWRAALGGIDVHFGPGSLGEVGPLAAAHGNSALLVTDHGLVASGAAALARRSLEAAGLAVEVLDRVSPNPTSDQVAEGSEIARSASIDVILAVGGGSVMDYAKGINFVVSNGGRMEDYWGFGKAARPMLPSLAAPTTAGTGSEAQSYALITQPGTGRKMACGDPKARFRSVVLDPDLLASAPPAVAAAAGMDALSHALESHVTTARTTGSTVLSRRAFDRLEGTVEAVAQPAGIAVRTQTMLGAYLAGAAIEASMLGAAHAAANPLTAGYGIPHGHAVGLMLPAVLRFNAPVAEALYRKLWPAGAEALAERVEAIRRHLGLPESLEAAGVARGDVADLAAAASEEWTGGFNPRAVDRHAFEELYAAAF